MKTEFLRKSQFLTSTQMEEAMADFATEFDNPKKCPSFEKFQSAYREVTGNNIGWKDIPESLQKAFLDFKPLSGLEFIKLPKDFGVAYLLAHKAPDDVILAEIKERLAFYERKYNISSEYFYRKYHNSEAIFDGSQERVLDFLLWHGDYRIYLELTNGSV